MRAGARAPVTGRAVRVLLVVFLLPWLLLAVDAKKLAREARKAEKRGDVVRAYLLYAQAAAAAPDRPEYWNRSLALRTRALQQSNALPALAVARAEANAAAQAPAGPAALDEGEQDPTRPQAVVGDSISNEELHEAARIPAFGPSLKAFLNAAGKDSSGRPILPPPRLKSPTEEKLSIDLRGDAKSLFEQVAQLFGVEALFDSDYQNSPRSRFQLENVDMETALRALEAMTSSFVVPLSDRLFMVFKDTPQKRAEAEPAVAVTLSLPNTITVQEAQELARAVQQTMELKRFAIDSGTRLVLMRDALPKVRAAQALYQQLLTHRAQALIEVELITMNKNHDLNYGMTLPTETAMAFLGRRISDNLKGGFRLIPNIAPGFTKFVMAGGGLSTIALAITDARAFASVSNAVSDSLFRATLRSADSQAATLHIGDKYPIITQRFQDVPSDISPLAVPPSFSFEDLGLTLKITPRIHSDGDVTMQVESEFKALGAESLNGIPVIATRKFNSTVRVRQGEYAILAGIVSATEARNISGIRGFGQLPILRHLFSDNSRSQIEGEALVVIKPHLTDLPPGDFPTPTIYTGTESRWVTMH